MCVILFWFCWIALDGLYEQGAFAIWALIPRPGKSSSFRAAFSSIFECQSCLTWSSQHCSGAGIDWHLPNSQAPIKASIFLSPEICFDNRIHSSRIFPRRHQFFPFTRCKLCSSAATFHFIHREPTSGLSRCCRSRRLAKLQLLMLWSIEMRVLFPHSFLLFGYFRLSWFVSLSLESSHFSAPKCAARHGKVSIYQLTEFSCVLLRFCSSKFESKHQTACPTFTKLCVCVTKNVFLIQMQFWTHYNSKDKHKVRLARIRFDLFNLVFWMFSFLTSATPYTSWRVYIP